ncbi:hypothetical protein BYT27DRAFT_7136777 [Phlegmacium glaucopus]|nr:hypothetical protein BYT27DRAFT_7136777 [Phlegmacium glaucopus]
MSIAPISAEEFARMMRLVGPSSRWSKTLAVANSGGSDSTCLLFLLNEYMKTKHPAAKPHQLLSLTVDHDLQPTSAQMAQRAAKFAESLGVEHVTTKILWGEGIYPPKPTSQKKLELLARDARYAALFAAMRGAQANALAIGHHVDDQVETMLMRLGRGTTKLGMVGMQPCSRWGMGSNTNMLLNWRGYEGLKTYKIRPLLDVGKERILATCEANKLEYVDDPTNFQPQLTIRNAIRHCINNGEGKEELDSTFTQYPAEIATLLSDINNKAAANYPELNISLSAGREHLRQVVKDLAKELAEVDTTVDEFLLKHRKPSAPGSLMVSIPALLEITSPIVRQALVLRMLRYVSYEPWGSPRSEVGRRQDSVKRLLKNLWDEPSLRNRKNISFTVGSGVWWKPAYVTKSQLLRTVVTTFPIKDLAWYAARHPSIKSPTAPVTDPLRFVMTDKLLEGRAAWEAKEGPAILDVLFDRRFLIRFRLDKMPQELYDALKKSGGVIVKPRSPWFLPEIDFKQSKVFTVLHTEIKREQFTWEREWGTKTYKDTVSDWITIEYIRPISSL